MGLYSDLRGLVPASWLVIAAVGLAGCEGERPRSYSEYLEDPIAREATLLRCNADRERSRGDAECINAKRAAAALAAQEDGNKRKRFEEQSDRKREALRARIAARQAAELRVQEDAKRRADAAYEQNWTSAPGDGSVEPDSGVTEPTVYTGQQFPAQPLQPGVSDAASQSTVSENTPYPSGQSGPGYPSNAPVDPYNVPAASTEASVQEPSPNQALPDAGTPAQTGENLVAPKDVLPSEPSGPSDEWQPFEPPPADQPAEG